jgi:phosphoribosylformimino-5-aminoimidazole carboxamide ribotide isomerase
MIIFPAIDLRGGKVVRLEQGRADRETVYDADPAARARAFVAAGAEWIHVVDLDGAFSGDPVNRPAVQAIVDSGAKVQLGGGIRDRAAVAAALRAGVRRVVVGTRAAVDPAFLQSLYGAFDPDQVAIGIDTRDGMVAVQGWVDILDLNGLQLARQVAAAGGRIIIYTDISRDGMLGGPNFAAQETMCRESGLQVIASGGVGALEHIARFRGMTAELPNLHGVIIGKALYDGRIGLGDLAPYFT